MVGLIDGPVAINHPDLTQETTYARPLGSARHMHAGHERGLPAWNLCRRHFVRQTGLRRAGDLPELHSTPIRPVFAETANGNAEPPNAAPEELAAAILECIEAGARVLNLSLALIPVVFSKAACAGGGAGPRREAGRARRGRGRQSGHGREHRHHRPSLGFSGRCVRFTRKTRRSIQSGSFDWAARVAGAGRPDYQPWGRGPTAHARRNKCRGAFRDGCDRSWPGRNFPPRPRPNCGSPSCMPMLGARSTVTPPLLNAWAAYQLLLTTHSRR